MFLIEKNIILLSCFLQEGFEGMLPRVKIVMEQYGVFCKYIMMTFCHQKLNIIHYLYKSNDNVSHAK